MDKPKIYETQEGKFTLTQRGTQVVCKMYPSGVTIHKFMNTQVDKITQSELELVTNKYFHHKPINSEVPNIIYYRPNGVAIH